MFKQVFFICILLLTPVHSRRSSGSGSFSSSRGSSGARQNVGPGGGGAPGGFNPQSNQGFHPQPNSGFHPQPNPGFQPNQGGFRPQPNQGFGGQHPGGGFNQGGFNNNRGFGGGTSHFVPGNGMGSAKSGSSFKTALAGAALGTIGGLAAFELGKAIISSASTPIHHNNKDYYWGQEYHQQKPGEIRCAMPLNDLIQNVPVETTTLASGATTAAPEFTTTPTPNQLLTQLQFANGTRPKEIVWSCKQGTEICCGTDCCAAPIQQNNMNNPNGASSQGGSGSSIFGIILGVLLVISLIACCCCFAVYKLCRSSLDSCLPSSNRQEEHYYEDGQKYEGPSYGNSYPLQPTQYSNQPYSNQPYPQQQQYPQQQPQQYPPHPDNQQGYYNQQKY